MKKTFIIVLTLILLTVVIAVFWSHITARRSGEQNSFSPSAEHADEAMPEPQQMKESLSQISTNRIESSVNAEPSNTVLLAETSDITEDKKMDVVNEAEQVQGKQAPMTNAVDAAQEKESKMMIKDDKARSIAREAIGDIEFDEKGEIRIERLDGKIRVVFPIEIPLGSRGPDYAAEVLIDAQSGEVLRTLGGS